MSTSAFGVQDNRIAKSALGTPEAALEEAHAAGKHADKASRYCPKCSGVFSPRAKAAVKVARKAV